MKKNWNSRRLCRGVLCMALATLIVLTYADVSVFAAKTEMAKIEGKKTYEIKGNGTNGITIDINKAPYTTYKDKSYGQYAYGKEGCAWFASARLSALTGKDTPIFDGVSWYNQRYEEYGFSRGKELHAKALACYEWHVAVVEKVEGDKVTVSEGGWTPAGENSGYTIIHTMTQENLESSRGTGKFLGYVYLTGEGSGDTDDDVPEKPPVNEGSGSAGSGSEEDNTDSQTPVSNGWRNDGISWQYYQNGNALAGQWILENGSWYYLKSDSYMAAGWLLLGNTWYYLNGDGSMATGWVQLDGVWYYLSESGAMLKSCWIGNYYVGTNGAMYTECWTPDGYYVNESGVWTI